MIVGGSLIIIAFAAFSITRLDRSEVVTVKSGEDAMVEPTESPTEPALLGDEALVAVALEAGDFPPGLAPGDEVMVTVRPDLDTGTDPRTIGRPSKIAAIEPPGTGDMRWIVVLRADRKLPEALVDARRVLLSIVAGGGK